MIPPKKPKKRVGFQQNVEMEFVAGLAPRGARFGALARCEFQELESNSNKSRPNIHLLTRGKIAKVFPMFVGF